MKSSLKQPTQEHEKFSRYRKHYPTGAQQKQPIQRIHHAHLSLSSLLYRVIASSTKSATLQMPIIHTTSTHNCVKLKQQTRKLPSGFSVVFITSGHLLQIWINIFDLPNIQIPKQKQNPELNAQCCTIQINYL
jgi:hypothetical protein